MTSTTEKTLRAEQLEFSELPFTRLFRDYLAGTDAITEFYGHPHTYSALKKAVCSFEPHSDRREKSRIIAEFNEPFLQGQTVDQLAGILAHENTVTITTGQQLSIFGGPLYTVFKTVSAIHLARSLTRDTGKRVVPVFWLADEDHDFEEISVVNMPEPDGIRQIALPCANCARHAAGSIRVDQAFEQFRSEIYESLKPTDFREQLVVMLDEAYAPGRSYREAFALLLSKLFSHHGLIFAGSNSPMVKKHVSECIRIAIDRVDEIRDTLAKQSERLGRHYHQQVQVTDSLLFWHDEEQGRVRLQHGDGHWKTDSGLSFSTGELLEKLDETPERFSPNVFLRPLIQDAILPNAAYIGGPAEIAYYGQMKPVYELFDRDMPFVAARFSATLVEPPVGRFLEELPFDFSDYIKRFEDLEQHYLRKFGNPELDNHFDSWKRQVDELTNQMIVLTGMEEPGLQKHARSLSREYTKSLDKLRKKMVNTIRQKEEVQVNRIHKVKHAFFPNNRLQEREIAHIYFMNKFGMDIWDRILNKLEELERNYDQDQDHDHDYDRDQGQNKNRDHDHDYDHDRDQGQNKNRDHDHGLFNRHFLIHL